jgi:hypothetical protein
MGSLLRPATVVTILFVLIIAAGGLDLLPIGEATWAGRAVVRPVDEGDHEVAWLNPATSAVAWERFVAAAQRLAERPETGVQIIGDGDPFPSQTTAVPELALGMAGKPGRLWIRWYKLTGELGAREWLQALMRRRQTPLAVMGGSSSDRARDLAQELQSHRHDFSHPPVLVITTATADQLEDGQALMDVYSGSTFRFCFTNRQMAEAVSDLLWHQDDLRPDAAPVYLARWEDDPYSTDLFNQFHDVLGPEGMGKALEEARTVKALARQWSWLAGYMAVGGVPIGLELEGLFADEPQPPGPFWGAQFAYSVGAFSQPNRYEMEAAHRLLAELAQHPVQRRPLLVLPATAPPARRFLRALIRTAPYDAERFVVATGDAIDFNTIYRDRILTWPIQDFPMPLVFFCHRNPVDPAGFKPSEGVAAPKPMGQSTTGTQDLLLYEDIIGTMTSAAYTDTGLVSGGDELSQRLHALAAGRRFDERGNQMSGAGEFVVCLRPIREGDRVLPRARMQVWNWRSQSGQKRAWKQVAIDGQAEMIVTYTAGRPSPE